MDSSAQFRVAKQVLWICEISFVVFLRCFGTFKKAKSVLFKRKATFNYRKTLFEVKSAKIRRLPFLCIPNTRQLFFFFFQKNLLEPFKFFFYFHAFSHRPKYVFDSLLYMQIEKYFFSTLSK